MAKKTGLISGTRAFSMQLAENSLRISLILVMASAAIISCSFLAEIQAEESTPADNLPPYITQITHFGQRADWSHDGKRVLFIEKTYGDVYEVDLETKVIRPVTHHYYHEGYVRALYLANGDILLSGARTFDSENPWPSRLELAELWVLDKSLKKPPVPLGSKCSEGPAVSRKNLKIAWTVDHGDYPDRIPEDTFQIWMGNIEYENGVPRLVNKKMVLDERTLPFECELETQNFRPPDEKEIIFSTYEYQGGEVMGVNIETGKVTNYTNNPEQYEEPEGIFPDGKYTTVERVVTGPEPFEGNPPMDIWKLALDGSGQYERLTRFSEVGVFRGTNPAISDDGRYMAFQMARADQQAGVGYGILIMDLKAAAEAGVISNH